jgi:Xaa-Pro aminopeptidase
VVQEIQDPGHEVAMLGFDALTLVPFDRRLIDLGLLSASELAWLDRYHARVWSEISDRLDDEDRAWLKAATAPLES